MGVNKYKLITIQNFRPDPSLCFSLPVDAASEAGSEAVLESKIGKRNVPIHQRFSQLLFVTRSSDDSTRHATQFNIAN